jgi:hypothetical protein
LQQRFMLKSTAHAQDVNVRCSLFSAVPLAWQSSI